MNQEKKDQCEELKKDTLKGLTCLFCDDYYICYGNGHKEILLKDNVQAQDLSNFLLNNYHILTTEIEGNRLTIEYNSDSLRQK